MRLVPAVENTAFSRRALFTAQTEYKRSTRMEKRYGCVETRTIDTAAGTLTGLLMPIPNVIADEEPEGPRPANAAAGFPLPVFSTGYFQGMCTTCPSG